MELVLFPMMITIENENTFHLSTIQGNIIKSSRKNTMLYMVFFIYLFIAMLIFLLKNEKKVCST